MFFYTSAEGKAPDRPVVDKTEPKPKETERSLSALASLSAIPFLVVAKNALFAEEGSGTDGKRGVKEDEIVRLCHLIEKGKEQEIEQICKKSPDLVITQTGENLETPLHIVARQGNLAIFNLLVDAVKNFDKSQASLEAENKYGETAIYYAARYGKERIVQQLINNGAKVHVANEDGYTPLHVAALNGHTQIVRWLLEVVKGPEEKQAYREAETQEEKTALYFAVLNRREDVVQQLIESGANVCKPSVLGDTPLHIAAWGGYTDIVEWLVAAVEDLEEKQAYLQAKNEAGKTARDLATEKGWNKIVQFLAAQELDPRQFFLHDPSTSGTVWIEGRQTYALPLDSWEM